MAELGAAMGRVDDARGRHQQARGRYQEARDQLDATVGPRHPMVADVVQDLAASYATTREHNRAITLQQRALTILREALGEHPRIAAASFALGSMRLAAGRRDDARSDWELALEMWQATRGKDHPDLAFALTQLAALDLEDGQAKQAVERLERALKVRGRKGLAPTLLADTQFALARALHASGEDRTRAQELARRALKTYEGAGPDAATTASTVDQWLVDVEHEAKEATEGNP